MGWLFDSSSFDKSKSMRCFNNELNGYCGGCNYMNPNNYSSGLFSGYSYKCVEKGGYYKWNEPVCRSVNYVDPERVDCAERYRLFTGRRYYILTAICDVLGIDYDNRLITEIRALIDIVRSDKTKTREAIGYEKYGEEIANMIRCDNNRVELCDYLLDNFIVKIYCYIGYNNLSEAITLYENMVKYLYYRYKNMDNYAEIIKIDNVNTKKLVK